MRTLYFDIVGGMSGDMTLAALLDAGASRSVVDRNLASLDLAGWSLGVERTSLSGIAATRVRVVVQEGRHGAGVSGSMAHGLSHGHTTCRDIRDRLESAPLDPDVRRRALLVFEKLAVAEGAIHDVAPDMVAFHEVGAVDSLIDIVGSAAALCSLSVDRVVASPVPLGRGVVRAEHGVLPLPAPATVRLLRGAPVRDARADVETVTPTGAAFLAAWADAFGGVPAMRLEREGYGAGHRAQPEPNLLRVLVGESDSPATRAPSVLLIEANIDDMNPEWFEVVFDELLGAGALDVWVAPIVMKRGRPAHQLGVLAAFGSREVMLDILYRETTTLGVRVTEVERDILEREVVTVETPFGSVRVKVGKRGGRRVNAAPEYVSAREVATLARVPLKDVYAAALAALL